MSDDFFNFDAVPRLDLDDQHADPDAWFQRMRLLSEESAIRFFRRCGFDPLSPANVNAAICFSAAFAALHVTLRQGLHNKELQHRLYMAGPDYVWIGIIREASARGDKSPWTMATGLLNAINRAPWATRYAHSKSRHPKKLSANVPVKLGSEARKWLFSRLPLPPGPREFPEFPKARECQPYQWEPRGLTEAERAELDMLRARFGVQP